MAVDETDGTYLRRLIWAAPGLGVMLLVLAGIGWLIDPRERPAQEEATLATNLATPIVVQTRAATTDLVAAPDPSIVAPDVDPAPVAGPVDSITITAEPAAEPEPPLAAAGESAEPPSATEEAAVVADDPIPPVVERAPIPIARPAPAPVVSAPVAGPRAGLTGYVVSPGETLSGIAARFGVSVETVRAANSLDASGNIRAGQTLQVPSTDGVVHVVTPGETLGGIAADHRVDRQAVAAANGVGGDTKVRTGQRLVIPAEPRGTGLASRQVQAPTPTPKRPTPKPTPKPR